MLNIQNAFTTSNENVYEYFQKPGVGFYIPLYQRVYSWGEDNMEQLLEDIGKGVEQVINDPDNEIRFLGTIITVKERDNNKINPVDKTALPQSIEKVIDGQQRLSSISLLSALFLEVIIDLQKEISSFEKKSPPEIQQLQIAKSTEEILQVWRDKLIDIVSVDLKRGSPKRKPKIIRGSEDKWVNQEPTNESYKSPVAKYLFEFINSFEGISPKPTITKDTNAGKNLLLAKNWIKKAVLGDGLADQEFPSAIQIVGCTPLQIAIWSFERQDLVDVLHKTPNSGKDISIPLGKFIQMLAACHYLLERCCFTIIQPIADDWAFDMFQSLNATGTPLTALETFKPLVVEFVESKTNPRTEFKNSIEDKYFSKIEAAFAKMSTPQAKPKYTSELITSIALPIRGEKLASHFSHQRRFLENLYNTELDSEHRKVEFVKLLGNYSAFHSEVWNELRSRSNRPTPKPIIDSKDSNLATLLLAFLSESNHRMSISLLGLYYSRVLEGNPGSVTEFTRLVKLLTGFYCLWRSAKSSSGLDDAYRSLFNTKFNGEKQIWIKDNSPNLDRIQSHLITLLKTKFNEDLTDSNTWIDLASKGLKYSDVGNICRLALFVSAHDTIADPSNEGLMKAGTANSNPFLTLENWYSSDYRSIEHVAPRKSIEEWDTNLYEDNLFDTVGNLTLLPSDLNSSAGNRSWKEKRLYYLHLGEKDPDRIQELVNKARIQGISLNPDTIKLLGGVTHAKHMDPIIRLSEDSTWDASLVRKRTKRILEIFVDNLLRWINDPV